MTSSFRSLLLLALALFGLVAQGVVLPDEAAAQEIMVGSVDCTAMTADRHSDTDQGQGNCGLPECLAMAVAGCAALALPGVQSVAKPSMRAIPSYFGAAVQAPVDVLPFPEIKPPII